MEERKARTDLVFTGKELLRRNLTARTWGNISERVDETHFVITPSGLSYEKTTEEDIVLYSMADGTYEGKRKPSSEKGIHAAAYELFPEVNFVIHTHQTYATALGLSGWDKMKMTEEEAAKLGSVARADYGLPGQKSLRENVRKALGTGAGIVLMVNHGALILGNSREDTLEKAELLEEVCRRNAASYSAESTKAEEQEAFLKELRKDFSYVRVLGTPEILARANKKKKVPAVLDDMAQMIGFAIPVVEPEQVKKVLKRKKAVLVPGIGAVVSGKNEEDTEALGLLTEKAVIVQNHIERCGLRERLSFFDVLLMHAVYTLKYSKYSEPQL